MRLAELCDHGRMSAHHIVRTGDKWQQRGLFYERGTSCPGGRLMTIDYEAALGAWHDTPWIRCGECLGDGKILVTSATDGSPKRMMTCHDCDELGSVPNEAKGISNAVDAALVVPPEETT